MWNFTNSAQHVCMIPLTICNLQMLKQKVSTDYQDTIEKGNFIGTDITLKKKKSLNTCSLQLIHKTILKMMPMTCERNEFIYAVIFQVPAI